MCGIAGCYQQADGQKLVDVMTDRIAHRGPDATGTWSHEDSRVSMHLGHLRLSIIDLSAAANQPVTKDGLTIVYNGELYNYKELRADLRARGVRFATESDTEVVLEAWRAWGPEALRRFRGMFAFALADEAAGDLVLARDPLGIKPLYYLPRGDGLLFASELKAHHGRGGPGAADQPRRHGRVDALLLGARPAVLHRGGAQAPARLVGADPARREAVRGALLADRGRGGRSRGRPGPEPRRPARGHPGVGAARTWWPTCRCRASCPAAWTRASSPCWLIRPARASTPTPSPSGPKTSGSRPCPTTRSTPGRSPRQFGIDLHEIEIAPDIVSLLPRMVDTLDEPIGDPAAINTLLMCEAARERGVKVILSGMGADELFGGYRKQMACLMASRYSALPALPRAGRAVRRGQDAGQRGRPRPALRALGQALPDLRRPAGRAEVPAQLHAVRPG